MKSERYWFDSFPGVEVEMSFPILDPYGTPYGGPEQNHSLIWPVLDAMDAWRSEYAPYTTVSQNRGGIA